jgi:hypothetical protein
VGHRGRGGEEIFVAVVASGQAQEFFRENYGSQSQQVIASEVSKNLVDDDFRVC